MIGIAGSLELGEHPRFALASGSSDDARFEVALGGRIDNAGELAGRSDPERILGAYLEWGDRAPDRILGDVAFVIWDRKERELFAARDFLGVHPFYYFWDGRTFLFASDLARLFADDRVPRMLNEGMIAEHLVARISSREETLYSAIRRLPPGHSLRLSSRGLRLSRWVSVEPREPLRIRKDEDYQDRLRSLLTLAVGARMEPGGPVGAYLSGGLDSTSVVALAREIGPVRAYSISFPGRECDEASLVSELGRTLNLPCEILPEAAPELESYLREAERTLQFPGYPNGAVLAPLEQQAEREGVGAILTGMGGDEWFMGSPPLRFFDRLRALRPRRTGLPSWIDPRFAARTDLGDRIAAHGLQGPLATLSSGAHTHVLEMQALRDVELRHPFLDRRVVEFALALPERQRRRGRIRKFVLREAMRGRLPDSIRLRKSKADFSHLFAETLLLPQSRSRMEALSAAERGWIDARKIDEDYREMRRLYEAGDPAYLGRVWPLWMALAIDLFLEATAVVGTTSHA